jgi:hypothetical protein
MVMMKFLLRPTLILFLLSSAVALSAQSMLWKISGKDLQQPSYLLGTIHITDKSHDKWLRLAEKYLPQCESYIMEVNDKGSFDLGMLNKVMNPGGEVLSDLISKEDYALVSQKFKSSTGFSISLFDRMQPLFIQAMLEVPNTDTTSPADILMMDVYLSKKAREAKMKVQGLETAEEQLAAVAAIPIAMQAKMLVDAVKEGQSNKDMSVLYDLADLEQLYLLTKAEMPQEALNAMLIDRNKRMAARIEDMMHRKPLFIAVGAAHLGGDEGIIKKLQDFGYTLTPILPG